MNTYRETLEWMFKKLPMYQRQGSKALKKDLKGITALEEHLGNPHEKIETIHVGGTNGKGSTSHMIASVLQEAGYRVGLFTSPHLKDYRERIKINGTLISKNQVVDFIDKNKLFLENHRLSFFEMNVGLAFYYFAKEKVDIAVIEVGLGGRLDSTNIIKPKVSVITNIGLDHTDFLGETISEIAFEKSGIIKANTPVVIGEFNEDSIVVFNKRAKEVNSRLILAEKWENKENYKSDLFGFYQRKNLKTAVVTLQVLKNRGFDISKIHIREGLAKVVQNTKILGRWQELGKRPKIVCDVAHNAHGLTLVIEQLQKQIFENLHIVIGFVNDKPLDKILVLFPKDAKYYFCKPDVPRGLLAEKLKEKAKEYCLFGDVYPSVSIALKRALSNASPRDFIYIGGSTFTVAQVL